MTEVVEARPAPGRTRLKASLAHSVLERLTDVCVEETRTGRRHEECGRGCSPEDAIAQSRIGAERFDGRFVERHLARFAEFRFADHQQLLNPADIFSVEAD